MEYRVEQFRIGNAQFGGEESLAEKLNQIASDGWVLVQLLRAVGPAADQFIYETIWQRPCSKHQKLNR